MGKLALIVVIGFAAIVAIVGTSLNRRVAESHRNNSSFYERTQARNVAKSANSIYQLELKKNPDLKGEFKLNIMGGSATVGVSEKVTGKREKLLLTTTSRYGGETAGIKVDANDATEDAPEVTGAIGISYLSKAKIKMGTDTYVDGNNYDLNGNKSSAFPAVAGVSLGHPEQLLGLEYTLKSTKILGKGLVSPNIETQTPQRDYYNWAMQLAQGADATYDGRKFTSSQTFGTSANPQVTYIKGKTTFNANVYGNGVLIVEGNVKFNNTLNWTGIIFCVADSVSSEKASFGGKNSQILGALMVAGKKSDIKLGDIDILYSREAVNRSFGLVATRMKRQYSFSNYRG